MADALSVVSLLVEGYGIENMSNSVVVEDNGRTRRAMVIGILAFGLSALMQTYYLVGGHLTPFLSIGIGFVVSAGLYVAFMLLRHRCRAFFIIGVTGICIFTIGSAINIFCVTQNYNSSFEGLFTIVHWLNVLSSILSAAGLFFLAGFLQGAKRSFVIGVSLFWGFWSLFSGVPGYVVWILSAISNVGVECAFERMSVVRDCGWCLSEILGLVSFFLVLKTSKMSGSYARPDVKSFVKKLRPTGFVEIFAWSIAVIGAICCFVMLINASPRSFFDERTPWNQGMVVESVLTFIKNVIVALIVLLIAKSDKASADIECLKRPVVIRVVQLLFALGAVILVGAFIWAVMASNRDFARATTYGMLSKGSLSDFLAIDRLVDDGVDLRTLVTIMIGVGIWYMVGFCFVWGALGRILGRVLGASAMKKSYEQQIQALKNSEPEVGQVES